MQARLSTDHSIPSQQGARSAQTKAWHVELGPDVVFE